MNGRRQFLILYREFLFRIVDRESLASNSKGDASQLLLQLLTLLIFLSVVFTAPALFINPGPVPQVRLVFGWSAEHFLIATTMLTVGIFAVLGWGAMFPDERDILVLAPLPVRAHTILLAKTAAMGTALAATVVALHLTAGLVWPLVLNATTRPYAIPSLTSDPALPPVGAVELNAVMDRDIAIAVREGFLAPGAGGGVSIGVYKQGVRRLFAYGGASPDSVFHIGSVTKVFTGLMLAQMIEQRRVRVDEPVRALIPGAGLVRPNGGPEITLLDLVTHHSGLPGMPADFRPRNPGNPFADFDVARLYTFLRARGVARPPDARFVYSNVGFGLLGHALATRARVDYETLVRQLITEPLRLTDTVTVLTVDQQRRLMQGYDSEHRPVQLWDVDALAGAGALKSTARDMLTWLEANLHPERLPPGTLRTAIPASHERRNSVDAGSAIGFAWGLGPMGDVGHPGDTSGFSADVSFNPSQDSAVVVLSNTGPGTSVSADVVAEHIRGRLKGVAPLAIAEVTIPARGSIRAAVLLFTAYWVTMLAAGIFVLGLMMGIQGVAAAILPRRHFLRVSSLLQVASFCVVVAAYFLQPMVVVPAAVLKAQQAGFLTSSPSYWFLGLFQTLSGSPSLAPLARRAVVGVSAAVLTTTVVCALTYFRTLRSIAEEPDSPPGAGGLRRLPAFGNALQTALVQFSVRTLFRSAQHRVIFVFYLGIGFAVAAVFLKTPAGQLTADSAAPGAWQETSLPLIVSSVIMMLCAVVGARLAFALPKDLSANWMFRILPLRGGAGYVTGRRRALMVVAMSPVWAVSAVVFSLMWPWMPVIAHLVVLALLGLILVELCLSGTQKIPFTCSYRPGKSRAHVAAYVALAGLLPLTVLAARFERGALENGEQYAAMIATIGAAWLVVRYRTSRLLNAVAEPVFEDEPADRVVTLDVWDSRFARPAGEEVLQ